jgi:hypothetical protein
MSQSTMFTKGALTENETRFFGQESVRTGILAKDITAFWTEDLQDL